jgi:hypothetical protein
MAKGRQAYLCKPGRSWHAMITGEGPQLTRSGGRDGKVAEHCHEDDDRRKYRSTHIRLCRVVEDLNIWLSGGCVDDIVQVTQNHAKGDEDHPGHGTVDGRGPDHAPGQYLSGIAKFFGHVDGTVSAEQRNHHGEDTNDSRKTVGTPTAVVIKGREDFHDIASWTKDPKSNEYGEETTDVDNQNNTLDQRQVLDEKGVEKDGEGGDGKSQERSVPSLRNVVRVVENHNTFDLGAGQESRVGCACLPAEDAKPACKPVSSSTIK